MNDLFAKLNNFVVNLNSFKSKNVVNNQEQDKDTLRYVTLLKILVMIVAYQRESEREREKKGESLLFGLIFRKQFHYRCFNARHLDFLHVKISPDERRTNKHQTI